MLTDFEIRQLLYEMRKTVWIDRCSNGLKPSQVLGKPIELGVQK